MPTVIEGDGKSEFVAFMFVFGIILIAGFYGIAAGKFKSAERIECEQFAQYKLADMPAKCVRFYQ